MTSRNSAAVDRPKPAGLFSDNSLLAFLVPTTTYRCLVAFSLTRAGFVNNFKSSIARPSQRKFWIDSCIEKVASLKSKQVAIFLPIYFALVVAVDFISGDEIALSMLYVPLIGLITIRTSLTVALNISVVCALIWLADDIFIEATSPTHGEWITTFIHLACFGVIATLIYRLDTALKNEKFISRHDFLTGLPNMHSFKDRAQSELNSASKANRIFSIVFVDCDNFKTVNDTLGHKTGDELLRVVSDHLAESMRSDDYVARYGGDEFVILLPNTDSETAVDILTRLQTSLNQKMQARGWPVTLSIGVATFEDYPASTDAAIKMADEVMYECKQGSKNGVVAKVIEKIEVSENSDHTPTVAMPLVVATDPATASTAAGNTLS